jgi:hypothetical protein
MRTRSLSLHGLWLGLAALLLLPLFTATSAFADGVDAVGQGDSQPFSCGRGAFLIGIAGRTGSWIDNFHPVCARWNGIANGLGPAFNGPTFGFSNGGDPDQAICARNEAVGVIRFGLAHPDTYHVQNVYLTCVNVLTMQAEAQSKVMMSDNFEPTARRSCPPGELATGIMVVTYDRALTDLELDIGGVDECSSVQSVMNAGTHPDNFSHHDDIADQARDAGVSNREPPPDQRQPSWHDRAGHMAEGGLVTTVPGSPTISGNWNTSQGPMVLSQLAFEETGSYGNDGQLSLKQDAANRWSGVWVQSQSSQRCDKKQNGSHFWGQVVFAFTDQNRHFMGRWSYCDGTPNQGWTGDRTH